MSKVKTVSANVSEYQIFKLPNICIGLKNPKSVGLYIGERLTPKLQTVSMKLINLKKLVAQLLLVKQSGLVQG